MEILNLHNYVSLTIQNMHCNYVLQIKLKLLIYSEIDIYYSIV